MGCIVSESRAKELEISRRIDKELMKQHEQEERKILILGTGGSGKSTFMKQLRIIHSVKFTDQELANYTEQCKANIKNAIKDLEKSLGTLDAAITEANTDKITAFREIDFTDIKLDDEAIWRVDQVWGIQEIKDHVNSKCINELTDSTPFFLENIKRMTVSGYIPTQEDILHLRVQTTGIIEQIIEHDGLKLKLCDVGGQRSERKKWFQCFNDVSAILFITSMADYNRRMFEDASMNSLSDSFTLFGNLCGLPDFKEKPFIVFLNKKDLFETKLKTIPLCEFFPEYKGKNEFAEAMNFIKQKFISSASESARRTIYFYETCATDTENIKFVFDACSDIILQSNIAEIGLG